MPNTSVLLVQSHRRHQGSAAELNRWVQSHRNRSDPETALTVPWAPVPSSWVIAGELINPDLSSHCQGQK